MKLPITPLLYLVSVGSLGGIVHAVIQYTDKSGAYDQKAMNEIRRTNDNLRKQGQSTNVGDESWNYASEWFWYQFRDANFIGKVEEKKQIDIKTAKVEDPKPENLDLNTVFDLICITSAGHQTGVVIKYKTDVDVPEKFKKQPSTTVMNTVPKGRRGRALPRPIEVSLESPTHHLKIGEKLWPRFEHVVLKSVSADARSATFELQLPDQKVEGKFPVKIIRKPVLGLPPGIAEKLMMAGNGGEGRAGGLSDPALPDQVPNLTWVDTPETTVTRDGRVNVARKDQRFLEERGPEIFNQDVHMRDYSGGSGRHKVRGVEIRKLSNRVRQFGINVGDVIISINNVKITGMASAKKVGRRLYRKGVRNFRAEILRGGRIITRTYTFKK